MTDLRVTLERVQVPNADCNRAPEEFQPDTDQCHLFLELGEAGSGGYGPEPRRLLRFDRSGDTFVLSSKTSGTEGEQFNASEDLAWFQRHDNTSSILDIVRIAGAMLSSRGIAKPTPEERAGRFVFPLVIAQYLVRGEVRFPDSRGPQPREDLAAKMLDVYANSNSEAVQALIGRIAFFEADPKLDADMKARVRWILGILRIVPLYKKFMAALIGNPTAKLTEEEEGEAISDLQSFAAFAMADLGARGRIRYNEAAVDAEAAFRRLHGSRERNGDFCKALEQSLGKIPELAIKSKQSLVQECREGLAAAALGPEAAVKYGLKVALKRPRGLGGIQAGISKETARANMPANWLAQRGQIDAVAEALLGATEVKVREAPKRPILRVDAAELRKNLQELIRRTRNTRQREPLLAAIGILRFLFGPEADKVDVQIELGGEPRYAEWSYVGAEIKKIQTELEAELRKSLRGSELGLPLAEAALVAGGAATLGVALGVKGLKETPRQALGFSGSTLLGMGTGALVTHYLLPPISKKMKRPVRNRYLWDLAGGLIGGAIGAGIWGLANYAGKGGARIPAGSPSRFPVDEYGP